MSGSGSGVVELTKLVRRALLPRPSLSGDTAEIWGALTSSIAANPSVAWA